MEFNYNMKSPSQSKNHNILLFVINFLQNFNHFEKLTENLKKIHVNITHKSYMLKIQCIKYYCLLRGAYSVLYV